MTKTIIAWAIMDRYDFNRKERYCYAGAKGTAQYKKKQVAIYFTKPKINKKWEYKKVVRKVRIETL